MDYAIYYFCKSYYIPENTFLASFLIFGYKCLYLFGTCNGEWTSWNGRYKNIGLSEYFLVCSLTNETALAAKST